MSKMEDVYIMLRPTNFSLYVSCGGGGVSVLMNVSKRMLLTRGSPFGLFYHGVDSLAKA